MTARTVHSPHLPAVLPAKDEAPHIPNVRGARKIRLVTGTIALILSVMPLVLILYLRATDQPHYAGIDAPGMVTLTMHNR
jgi:hypothetical protein